MTTLPERVVATTTVPLFGAIQGAEYEVLRWFWQNGEGWYVLRRADGSELHSPDVFWRATHPEGGITPEGQALGHRYVQGHINAYCPKCSEEQGVCVLDCDYDLDK